MSTIRLENVGVAYGQRQLIQNLNIEIPAGSTLGIIGANGTGKSSLLRVMASLQKPSAGKVFWNKIAVDEISQNQKPTLAATLLSNFARVNGFTVKDLVALGRQPYTGFFGKLRTTDHQKVTESIAWVGLQSFEEKQIAELSDGEFRKAMLAKLLAQDTELLFLDEPTTHIDLPSSVDFLRMIRALSRERGKCVILTSHELSMLFQVADQILLLNGDGQFALGTPSAIASHELMCSFLKTDRIRFEEGNLILNFKDR